MVLHLISHWKTKTFFTYISEKKNEFCIYSPQIQVLLFLEWGRNLFSILVFWRVAISFLILFFLKKKKKVSLNTSYLLPRTLAVNLLVTPGCLHSTQFFMPSSLFIILIKSVSLLSQEIQGLTLSKGRRQFAVVEGA